MANENETVARVCEVLRKYPKAEVCDGSGLTVLNNNKIADRIIAAHKREMAELREFSDDMRTWFRMYYSCGCNPKSKWSRRCDSCRLKRCPIHKWRKTLAEADGESEVA